MDKVSAIMEKQQGPTAPSQVVEAENDTSRDSVHDLEQNSLPNYPGEGTHASPYVVDWDIGDLHDPYNWPKTRKWPLTLLVRFRYPFGAEDI